MAVLPLTYRGAEGWGELEDLQAGPGEGNHEASKTRRTGLFLLRAFAPSWLPFFVYFAFPCPFLAACHRAAVVACAGRARLSMRSNAASFGIGIGPIFGPSSKARSAAREYAGQAGRPLPLGSPVAAKFAQ